MMRRSLSRPQQLREQLLQAIDEQNNIQNASAVLDVICCLEKYPMTKEALMETRLGKLINDVRKKSSDEDVVKRLKRLVRSWQRLIGATENELSCSADAAHLIRGKLISRSTQTFGTADQRAERCYGSASGKSTNHFRRSKIPIRAINPYSSSLVSTTQPYASVNVRSLSNQPPQDHQNVLYPQKSKSFSQKNLVTGEPALSTSAVPRVPSHSSVQESHTKGEQVSDFMNNHSEILKNTLKKVNLFSPTEVSNGVKEPTVRTFEKETIKDQHGTSNDKHNEHHIQDNNKPVKLNGSILAYDHHIKLISCGTSDPPEDGQRTAESGAQGSEEPQETNSSEPSQRKMIEPDTIFQNSLTTESQTLGMNLNVAENLKKGDDGVSEECREADVFIPDFCMTELPGISRDLTENDLYRLHHDQWHGVNGCYDKRNNWYDWTQSFTLDSYASPLKISPYVCIDYRL